MTDELPLDEKGSQSERHLLDAVDALRFGINSVKASIEAGVLQPSDRPLDPVTTEFWKMALLRIEGVRLDIRSFRKPRSTPDRRLKPHELQRLAKVSEEIKSVIRELLAAKPFQDMADRTRLRISYPTQAIPLEFGDIRTVSGALVMSLDIADALIAAVSQLQKRAPEISNIRTLRDLVPTQKVSPVQFAVKRGKLAVIKQPAKTEEADAENVHYSRDALLSKGYSLVEELQRSNCDRRLLQSVAELQQSLASCENVIRLGLMNIGVEEMCKAFVAELPDAIRGMMLGHTRGIAMYVAQFPDWQKFSEKAASVELTQDDIKGVSETAKRLAADLEQHPEIADEEVPKTIRALQQLIDNPALATKRAAYALLRTIENLVAKTLEYCTDLLDKTAQKTVECVSGMASKTLATMMAVALVGAVGLTPVSAKIADTAWVKEAAEIVKRQIEAFEAK